MTILCEPDECAARSLLPCLVGGARAATSLAGAAQLLAADPSETLVVLGAGVRLDRALGFAERLTRDDPRAQVILLRESVDAELVGRAHRAGAHTVLATSDRASLAEACRSAHSQQPGLLAGPGGARPAAGGIVTVFSTKGGSGKTMLAVNLAAALAAVGTGPVCLVDLDLDTADVAAALRLRPRRSIVDAAAPRATPALASFVTSYRPGLDCVLAPTAPGQADRVPAKLVTHLLATLPSHYEHVVVDTPARFSEHALAALDASDQHVLLSTPELPALRGLRETLDVLDLLGHGGIARSVVVNRASAPGGSGACEIEAIVRQAVVAHIPYSSDVPASINRGVPLVTDSPEHPVSRAVLDFARTHIVGRAPQGGHAWGRDPPRSRRPS